MIKSIKNKIFLLKDIHISITRNKFQDRLAYFIMTGTAIFVVLILVMIFGFLVKNSLPFVLNNDINSYFNFSWNPSSFQNPSYGILVLIINSLIIAFLSIVMSFPLALGMAVLISEKMKGKLQSFSKSCVEILAAIPSVVIGFIGLNFIGPNISSLFSTSSSTSLLNAAICLSIMSLPIMITIMDDSLKQVPKSLSNASYALGATRWQTLLSVKIPYASSGIWAATMLGFGRIVGETMTVLMVSGNSPQLPSSLIDSVRTITATIAAEMGDVAFGSNHFHGLFFLGFILFMITLITNIIGDLITGKKYKS